MSSSPLQNPEPRKWRFTWETLAHIPTLRLFLFNPDHRPSIQCRNLKSSLNFELSLLSVSWIEDESIDLSVEFELRVPIPRVLIDPGSPVDARALEDHIEVKLVLLLPVDHPLVTADFESVLDASEEGVGGGNGGSNRLMPLSLDSDIRSLSSEGGVHLYCKNCSTKLTRIPLRSFLEIPSVDWREVADNWFGACCCSFGGISEKLVAEYVNSHICANGTCLLDDTSVIICKDDLEGYSFSDHLDNDLKHELKLDLVGKDDSTDCIDSRTNGGGGLSTACGNDGTDDICGTLSSLSLGEKAFHKSHSISECAGKLSQGTGYCFTENTDVAHSIIDEKCSTNMDFLEQELEPTSVRLEKQYSASDLMKNQSHCCVNETHYRSSPLHERSFHNVSIPSTKEEQLTKYAKLQTNQKWLPNGAAGGGFMITSADISNDVEWVRFLCSNCSSLLGSFPSAKDRYTPVDGGVRLFKCYISTTVPVGGSADTFRNHTLQRVFVNRLLESAAEELSFRTIVKDLKDKSPMLQIIILNPKSWCSTGCCLDAENGAEPIPKITLHPVVKVLFSDCSIATKAGMREIEEWANRKQAAEVYMLKCQIQKLIESLKSTKEGLPASCTSIQGLSLSSMER
ncbi:hypothetical protein AAC387_Pa10g1704 [Persea americana]